MQGRWTPGFREEAHRESDRSTWECNQIAPASGAWGGAGGRMRPAVGALLSVMVGASRQRVGALALSRPDSPPTRGRTGPADRHRRKVGRTEGATPPPRKPRRGVRRYC